MRFFAPRSEPEPEVEGEQDAPRWVDLAALEGVMAWFDRFPRPDWAFLDDYVEQNVPAEHFSEAWWEIVLQWLRDIQDGTRSPYEVYESDHFLMLAALPEKRALALMEFAENALERVQRFLGPAAREPEGTPEVVLVFRGPGAYYRYVGYHLEGEGDLGQSQGMFLNTGYIHIAMHGDELASLERVLVHELTHSLVCDLPLPAWLNEGLAQIAEGMLGRAYTLDRETAQRHYSLWNADLIAEFWSGRAFHRSGDVQELSYHLAETLTRMILEDHPDRFPDFVLAANLEDAGEASAVACLGAGLGELVGRFLGPGNWAPTSPAQRETS
ncbi:MAG: hypothetical protein AB1758_25160 [Candidatus Eremiobacterota bacterium]